MRNNTALILGATGGIGGEVARQMRDAGWHVKALTRGLEKQSEVRDGITWVRGDAMTRADVVNAAKDCSVIVHAVNPPGYRNWSKLVLPMLDNTIAAAIVESAHIVLPGTIYNYGPDAFANLTENSPQQPQTRKGAIRVEMERRLHEASRLGAKVLIVRAGDFFGPKAGNNWFAQGLIKAGQPISSISNPGSSGTTHQWAYLPDVARTMITLLERRHQLEDFARFHLRGHVDPDGLEMVNMIARVVARHTGKTPVIKPLPWWLLTLISPFVVTLREMMEMRYLWRTPVIMDNSKLRAVIGFEPHTPLEQAVEESLIGLGCLTQQASFPKVAAPALIG